MAIEAAPMLRLVCDGCQKGTGYYPDWRALYRACVTRGGWRQVAGEWFCQGCAARPELIGPAPQPQRKG